MKARVHQGATRAPKSGAPESARRMAAADDGPSAINPDEVKNAMEKNGIGNGKTGTLPPKDEKKALASLPAATREAVLKGPKPKKAKKPKLVTPDLPEMPKPDGVGKAADRMKDAIEACVEAVEEKGEAESALIKALKAAKRTSIQVGGYKFQYKHTGPTDKITVQKAK